MINPFRTLLVNDETFALKEQMKSSTTESLSLLRKLSHPAPESFVPILLGLIAQRISTKTDKPTGPPLTQPKALYDIGYRLSPCLGL
jgi:hypothetical protein